MHDSPFPTSRDQAGRRATIMTVVAGLSVVVAVAIWIDRQQSRQATHYPLLSPASVAQPPASDRLIGENPAGDVLGILAGAKSVSQLMMTSSQDRLLLEEPANLPAYPGAKREAGIRRLSGGIVEETVFWHHEKISAADLQAFYRQAIAQAGFLAYPRQPSPPTPIIHQLYLRSPCPAWDTGAPDSPLPDGRQPTASDRDEVLMLRIWPSPDGRGTHWMLWLRYPHVP